MLLNVSVCCTYEACVRFVNKCETNTDIDSAIYFLLLHTNGLHINHRYLQSFFRYYLSSKHQYLPNMYLQLQAYLQTTTHRYTNIFTNNYTQIYKHIYKQLHTDIQTYLQATAHRYLRMRIYIYMYNKTYYLFTTRFRLTNASNQWQFHRYEHNSMKINS